jgi:hypothetical protein
MLLAQIKLTKICEFIHDIKYPLKKATWTRPCFKSLAHPSRLKKPPKEMLLEFGMMLLRMKELQRL